MKLIELLNIIHNINLVEIVDTSYNRIFYGQVRETVHIDLNQIAGMRVVSISPFEAQISTDTFVPAIQIVASV